MTISDKIRVYELSRDLNLDNKDIIDAAQKLAISVKSHSSSISLSDAKKIKNLIKKSNSVEKIISVKKPSTSLKKQPENPKIIDKKNTQVNSITNPPTPKIPNKANLNQKPLLIRPINKPNNPQKPAIISSPKSQLRNANQEKDQQAEKTNPRGKNLSNPVQNKQSLHNTTSPSIKSPKRPPIQLIEKPKNLVNNLKAVDSNRKNNSLDKKNQFNKLGQNSNKNNKSQPRRFRC